MLKIIVVSSGRGQLGGSHIPPPLDSSCLNFVDFSRCLLHLFERESGFNFRIELSENMD